MPRAPTIPAPGRPVAIAAAPALEEDVFLAADEELLAASLVLAALYLLTQSVSTCLSAKDTVTSMHLLLGLLAYLVAAVELAALATAARTRMAAVNFILVCLFWSRTERMLRECERDRDKVQDAFFFLDR